MKLPNLGVSQPPPSLPTFATPLDQNSKNMRLNLFDSIVSESKATSKRASVTCASQILICRIVHLGKHALI